MTFKAAKCPNCAGELQLPDDRDNVKCMYCGSDIVVREAIKLAGGVNIGNLLELAEQAEKSNKLEEAYKYYSKILEHDSNNVAAWVGRGICTPGTSKTDIDHALEVSGDTKVIVALIKKRFLELGRGISGGSNWPVLHLIYQVDSKDPFGLLGKAFNALQTDIKQGRNEFVKYYREALSASNNDPHIMTALDSAFCGRLCLVQGASLSQYLERCGALLSLSHTLWPTQRDIEKGAIADLVYFINRRDVTERKPTSEQKQILRYLEDEVKKNPSDRNYSRPLCEDEKSCFIATAAYGSHVVCEVELLREFRDTHLETNPLGYSLVKAYYLISPPIAAVIGKSDFLKAATRQLLKPIIAIVKIYSGRHKS